MVHFLTSVYTAEYDETWDKLEALSAELPEKYYLILRTNASDGPYYILARQYIATQLNILNGAPMNEEVKDVFYDARLWLLTYYPEEMLSFTSSDREEIITLALILDDYNNGVTGPGACLDD